MVGVRMKKKAMRQTVVCSSAECANHRQQSPASPAPLHTTCYGSLRRPVRLPDRAGSQQAVHNEPQSRR